MTADLYPTGLTMSHRLKGLILKGEAGEVIFEREGNGRLRFDTMTVEVSETAGLLRLRIGYWWRGKEMCHVVYPLIGLNRGDKLTIDVGNLHGDMPFKLG